MRVKYVRKWCRRYGSGGMDLLDVDSAGRPEGQEELILEKWLDIIWNLWAALELLLGNLQTKLTVKKWGTQTCAPCVPTGLKEGQTIDVLKMFFYNFISLRIMKPVRGIHSDKWRNVGAPYHPSNRVTSDVTWVHCIILQTQQAGMQYKKPKLSISLKIKSASGYWKVPACVLRVEGETNWLNACFGTHDSGRQSNATRCDKLMRLSAGGDLDTVALLHKNVTSNEAFRRVEMLQSFHLKHLVFLTLWRWSCLCFGDWSKAFGYCRF